MTPERRAKSTDRDEIFLHVSAPDQCAHQWDGPEVDIGNGTSATCSKCGMTAISYSLRTAP